MNTVIYKRLKKYRVISSDNIIIDYIPANKDETIVVLTNETNEDAVDDICRRIKAIMIIKNIPVTQFRLIHVDEPVSKLSLREINELL